MAVLNLFCSHHSKALHWLRYQTFWRREGGGWRDRRYRPRARGCCRCGRSSCGSGLVPALPRRHSGKVTKIRFSKVKSMVDFLTNLSVIPLLACEKISLIQSGICLRPFEPTLVLADLTLTPLWPWLLLVTTGLEVTKLPLIWRPLVLFVPLALFTGLRMMALLFCFGGVMMICLTLDGDDGTMLLLIFGLLGLRTGGPPGWPGGSGGAWAEGGNGRAGPISGRRVAISGVTASWVAWPSSWTSSLRVSMMEIDFTLDFCISWIGLVWISRWSEHHAMFWKIRG